MEMYFEIILFLTNISVSLDNKAATQKIGPEDSTMWWQEAGRSERSGSYQSCHHHDPVGMWIVKISWNSNGWCCSCTSEWLSSAQGSFRVSHSQELAPGALDSLGHCHLLWQDGVKALRSNRVALGVDWCHQWELQLHLGRWNRSEN